MGVPPGWRELRSLEVETIASGLEPLFWEYGLVYDRVGLVRPCFAVQTSAAVLEALAQERDVFSIVVADPNAESGAEGDGTETRDGHQLRQYWNAGFVGEEPSSISGGFNDVTIALLDRGFQDQHIALRDTASATAPRIKGRFTCDGAAAGSSCSAGGSQCTSATDLPFLNRLGKDPIDSLSDHGTTILGVLLADVTDGQDPAVPVGERDQRSGHAVEASVVFLQNGSADDDYRCADRAESIERAALIHADIASHSEAHGSKGCLCTGANNGIIERVNDAFKDGLLYVKAAGNNFADGTVACPCTVTSPGTAEGSLTVGGIANPGVAGSQTDVRTTNSFHPSSSMGGGEMGRPGVGERSIVGLSAWACVELGTECQDETSASTHECPATLTADYGSEPTNCGTSYATPQVAAAAAMFKDHWINELAPSTFLNNAAQFKTVMLLMGDRWDGATGQLASGFRPRAGGGRLKMRMFNEAGMDAQWVLRTGSVDLYDGDLWHVAMNPTTAGFTSARRLKAVIWWYEPMTETTAADITFSVERFQNPNCSGPPTTLNGDVSYDNKKMVVVTTGIIGQCVRLRIERNDITANDEAGNQLVRRVNWAAYVEDTQRNDADGPVLTVPADSVSVELP